MFKTSNLNFISDKEIESIVSFKDAITVTENAFHDYFLGKNTMPKKVYLDLPQFSGDFRAMPAYNDFYQIAGVKWVNSHSLNAKFNLPTVRAMMIVNDPKTATPLAILEASEITNLRTGASGALSIKYLTKDIPLNIVCVGAGKQAFYQIMCANEVRSINSLIIIDNNHDVAEQLKIKLETYLPKSVSIQIKTSLEKHLKKADVIITTTPSKSPIIFSDYISSGVLINAIGADAPGKQELDHELIKKALIVVDDMDQALHSGEVNTAVTSNQISRSEIYSTLGEIIHKKTFNNFDQTKVFDSTGLSIQDLALAGFIMKKKNIN